MSTGRKHIRVACAKCRERKSKCDGRQPACLQCQARGTDCDYSQSLDRRTSNRPHKKIAELEQEIARLKRQLGTLGQETIPQSSSGSWDPALESAVDPAPVEAPSYSAVDHFHINPQTGQMTYMGPTSIPPAQPRTSATVDSLDNPQLAIRLMPEAPSILNLTMAAHEHLLQLFFCNLNGWGIYIDEAAFRHGFAASAHDPTADHHPYYSRFLHLCVLATTARFSQSPEVPPTNNPSHRGYPFLQAAMALLGSELEHPKPSTIFGLNLLNLNLSDMGKEFLAYIIKGVADRMSHGIGLHINVNQLVLKGTMEPLVRQSRDDAYWSITVEDVLVSLYVGRLPVLRELDHDLKLETNPAARLIDCRGVEAVLKHATLSICNIGSKVIKLFYSVHNERHNLVPRMEAIREELSIWRQRFDPRLLPEPQSPTSAQAFTCLALHNTILILLNRPMLQRKCLDTLQGTSCLSAAMDTADLMRMNHENNTLIHGPVSNSQNMHVAGSVLLLLVADLNDSETHQTELKMAQSAVDSIFSSLSHLSKSWAIAGQALSALENMRAEHAVRTDSSQSLDLDDIFEEVHWMALSSFTDMPDPFDLDQIFMMN